MVRSFRFSFRVVELAVVATVGLQEIQRPRRSSWLRLETASARFPFHQRVELGEFNTQTGEVADRA